MGDLIIINAEDNVAVVMRDLAAGDALELPGGGEIVAVTDIQSGHKIALVDLLCGDGVIKYGEEIGRATADISRGEWVHTHNIE